MSRFAILVLALASMGVPPAGPQTFRVRADYVEVDVFVSDGSGRFVRGLQKSDFQLREDGRPVDIASLELVDLPPAATVAARSSAPATDLASNSGPATGRLYILVLDDLHTPPDLSGRARALATRFLERNVAPGDLVSIVPTSGQRNLALDFTDDRDTLAAVIGSFVGLKAPSGTVATYGGGVPLPAQPGENAVGERERHWQARAALETLTRLSSQAAFLHGRRKALVLVSTGMDIDLGAAGTPRELKNMVRDLAVVASNANLSIYPVDPRGLTQGGEDAVGLTGTGAGQSRLQDERRFSIEGLQILARETGGRAFVNSSEFVKAFDAIDQSNSTYYMLAYNSPTPADGRFHAIDVRVVRPGLVVRARKGYVKAATEPVAREGGADTPSPELHEALADPRPSGGVGLEATVSVFRSTAERASVVTLVRLASGTLTFQPAGDKMHADVEMGVVAFDQKGDRLDGDRTTLSMDLTAENYDRARREGIVVPFRLALPPGRWQLRVGARDGASGRVGTVRCNVEVVDYAASASWFSSLVAVPQPSVDPPIVRADDSLKRLLGAYPTLSRSFDRAASLRVAALLYGRPAAGARPNVTAELTTGATTVAVYDAGDTGAGVEAGERLLVATIPLTGLTPGPQCRPLHRDRRAWKPRGFEALRICRAVAQPADSCCPPPGSRFLPVPWRLRPRPCCRWTGAAELDQVPAAQVRWMSELLLIYSDVQTDPVPAARTAD